MMRYGLFRIGLLNYAISLLHIQKILQGSKLYTLPRLPGAVSAVLIDDGALVPLLDLGRMLGVDSEQGLAAQSYQVLVDSDYGTVALSADLTGQIVTEQKVKLSEGSVQGKEFGAIGSFFYQCEEYKILDISLLSIEMTQGFWQGQSDTGGARRHQ